MARRGPEPGILMQDATEDIEGERSETSSRLRSVAFYLPQYHPIPENDRWWGAGFTDWDNVKKAVPLFRGHNQPDLPGDLGFYDLRDPDVQRAQAELALSHGVDAFCYYHYWFSGKRLLELPLDEVLRTALPDLPFCLCWANENWTRNWDGQSNSVLLAQDYSPEDDRVHGRWLAGVFADPRYLRIDGRPLLLVYRASSLPEPRRTAEIWREEAAAAGVGDPYLCKVERFAVEEGDPERIGFDAATEFAPGWDVSRPLALRAADRCRRLLGRPSPYVRYSYQHSVSQALERPVPGYLRFPCVFTDWDNSPRRPSGASVFVGSTPERYGAWVEASARRALALRRGDTILFVNAWNEWAEGAHLEPDRIHGHAYLDAHAEAMRRVLAAGAAR
ncbi:MAG TPA: glycoside hydrolase family 99-like domain-containing protein [Acidimicrobiales bacterium]|nr:glycoside hydrolase family 99-like domain-containing protein [Acidimicrobiales bacterium]